MPQRYFSLTPTAGCNLYQAYAPASGSPQGVSQIAQLGMEGGVTLNGALNTRWCYAINGATPVVANTAINIDPALFTVGGTGGIAGKSLIAVPANCGAWYEISGATLNLTQLQSIPVRLADESEADYHARLVAAHAAVGENPDGTPLADAKATPPAQPYAKAEQAEQHGKAHDKEHDRGARK
jgi:hypothetical protein